LNTTIHVSAHDCDGVSIKDIAMAKAMEEYAAALMPFDITTDDEE
jgi:pterin-4a-carbinolamine dehydratase